MEHFNKLTPAEAERLAILAEEAGEVVQAVGKILRHGYESHHPNNSVVTNRISLEQELGDLFAVAHDMCRHEDLNPYAIEQQRGMKLGRLEAGTLYLHHQREETR